MSIVEVDSGGTGGGGGGVPPTRLINTTLPLTGGGDLSADRTLAVDDATTTTVGVVKLAANLGGTGVLPLVTGLTADVITIQNLTGLTHKGVWNTVGLRIGDNTAPTEKLEVVGNETATGSIQANTGGTAPITLRVWVGGAGYGALYITGAVHSAANHAVLSDGGSLFLNAPNAGFIYLSQNNVIFSTWLPTGLRIGDGATASSMLDVLGRGTVGVNTGKVFIDSGLTTPTTEGCLWGGAIVPDASNYMLKGTSTFTALNAPTVGAFFLIQNTAYGRLTTVGWRLGDSNPAETVLDVVGDSLLGKTDESSKTALRGGELGTVHEVNTAYTIDSGTVTDRLLVVLASGGDVTITLPATSAVLPPTGTLGRKIIIKRKYGSDSTVFVSPDGADTIEGAATVVTLTAADDGIEPFCEVEDDGTTWQVTRIHGGQIAPP